MNIMQKSKAFLLLFISLFVFSCEDSSTGSVSFKNITGNWSGKGIYRGTYSIELNLNLINNNTTISRNPDSSNFCIIELLYMNESDKYICYPSGKIIDNKIEISFKNTLGTSSYSGIVNETLDTITGIFSAENLSSVGVSDSDVDLVLVKH